MPDYEPAEKFIEENMKAIEESSVQIAYNLSPMEAVAIIHALRFMNEELGGEERTEFLTDLTDKIETIARAYFPRAR